MTNHLRGPAKRFFLALASLALITAVHDVARADSVILTLTNPSQTATPGTTLVFSGILTNPTPGAVDLGYQVGTNFPITFDPSLPFTLAGESTTGNIVLFSMAIPNTAFSGVYPGEVAILYTSMTSGQNGDSRMPYQVTVIGGGTAPVPEPATITLLGIGLTGALLERKRRRKKLKEFSDRQIW